MGGSCIVCGKKSSSHNVSLHRFPKNREVRIQWLKGLSLTETDITENSRVCTYIACISVMEILEIFRHSQLEKSLLLD